MFRREREALVNSLIRNGFLKSPSIIDAFKKVPRHEFVPEGIKNFAYEDRPQPIGKSQTISAPSMIAIMMESLDFAPGQRVLEIGAGSGYNAALVAEVVGPKGEVFTIERVPELAKSAERNLKKTGYGRVKVVVGDGSLGYEEGAPWDRILVTACAPDISKPLIKQLKIGGKIGAPIGHYYMSQMWTTVEKTGEEQLRTRECCPCAFVPLVGEYGWKEEY